MRGLAVAIIALEIVREGWLLAIGRYEIWRHMPLHLCGVMIFIEAAAVFTEKRFFKEFAYPSLFSEDPRYYRLGQGKKSHRFLHAVEHSVVAYNDHGNRMFNFSEWLGEISGASLGNLYHPGNRRGFWPAASEVAVDVGLDAGYDELKEFWPEIARKLRLPFRDQNEALRESPPATNY